MEQTKSWIRKTWDELKKLPAHYTYLQSLKRKPKKKFHGDKVIVTHCWGKTYRGKRPAIPGNHDRYIISHARKMGISTTEYKRKFCA